MAAQCLVEIAKEIESANESAGTTSATTAAPSQSQEISTEDKSAPPASEKETKTTAERMTVMDDSHKKANDRCATAQDLSRSASTTAAQSQDATASPDRSTSQIKKKKRKSQPRIYTKAGSKEGHDLLWPKELAPSMGPTLLTGLKMGTSEHLIGKLVEWERKFESADLVKHKQFLQEAQLFVCDNPLEATAWSNGFVPEARGLSSDQLDFRIQGSLPPLAYRDHGVKTKAANRSW